MLGLTWDCIDIAPQSIENGSAYIFVNKELQRVTRGALDDLSDKGVIKKFPPCIASTHTALVLKEPKTKTSIRRVYLPKTVAYMLVERKKEIDELMDLFGDEYIDNNLVFCSSNGRPMESQVINRAFNKLIKENGLPHVVFHSLRHSSITYKLKLNGGDMKSVQGDSGHAQVKMVADVYSHIIDEDRCINAQRLEEAFTHPRLLILLKIQSLKLRILPSLKVMQRRYWNCLKIPKLPHCSSSWQKLYKVPPSEERLSLCERFSSFEPLCTVTKHFFC